MGIAIPVFSIFILLTLFITILFSNQKKKEGEFFIQKYHYKVVKKIENIRAETIVTGYTNSNKNFSHCDIIILLMAF